MPADGTKYGAALRAGIAGAALLGLQLVGCASGPRPMEEQPWVRLETPHFGMWTPARPDVAKALLQDLERFRTVLPALDPLPRPDERIEIVLFADAATLDRFVHTSDLRSAVVQTLDGPILIANATVVEPAAALRHAYLHELSWRAREDLPAWMEEGRAEALAHAQITDAGVILGAAPAHLKSWLQLGTPLPAVRILSAEASRIGWSRGEDRRFAAYAWVLHGLLRDRSEDADTEVAARLLHLSESRPAPRTLRPGDARIVDAALRARIPSGPFPRVAMEIAPLPAVDVQEVPAVHGEALAQLARLADALGSNGGPTIRQTAQTATEAEVTTDAAPLDARDPAGAVALAEAMGDDAVDHQAAAALLQLAHAHAPGVPRIERALAARLAAAGEVHAGAAVLNTLARRPHADALVPAAAVVEGLALAGISLADADARLWNPQLAIRQPAHQARLDQLAAWVEVVGDAGFGTPRERDIVIVLDISTGTFLPSEQDVNANGRTGRRVEPFTRGGRVDPFTRVGTATTSDRMDSIFEAERFAARELLLQLDPLTTQVAIVGYSSQARTIAPLGSIEAALDRLDRFQFIPRALPTANPAAGQLRALKILRNTARDDRFREASVLHLFGAEPTHPNSARAQRRTAESTDALRQLGIPVHAFGVGESIIASHPQFLEGIAAAGGGTYQPIHEVRDTRLPALGEPLRGLLGVEVRNLTTGEPARAQRVFQDGSFDALVPLALGTNEIETIATLDDHPPLRNVRSVDFVPPEVSSEPQRRKDARLLWALRNRSIEVAARLRIAEAQAQRAERAATIGAPGAREVEIEVSLPEDTAVAPEGEDLPAVSGANPTTKATSEPGGEAATTD